MPKLSIENATEQLAIMADYYELDWEEDFPKTDKGGSVGTQTERKLLKAIQNGRLEISETEDGIEIVQHLKRKAGNVEKLVYKRISGNAKTALKDLDKGSPHAKIYALLGAISGEGETTIRKLTDLDLSTAECLSSVFSAV
jgi:hypothetical protein